MPGCRITLVIDPTETDDEALIGEMCHMVAESPIGPRGESPLSIEERNKYNNLILLCRNHHREIDTQYGAYPVDLLKKIKGDHEYWVSNNLPGYDKIRQRDDEIYAGYLDEWAQRCHLDRWDAWRSFVLGGGQPQMTIELDSQLGDLRRWLRNRIWPGRYLALERAFNNFALVLNDFQNTFHEHAEKYYPDAELLMTKKFYRINEWNPELYDRLARSFDHHVDLVQDLMLELTRSANLICDEARASILPRFYIEKGRLSAVSGPHMDLKWHEMVAQYSSSERAANLPYPGLEKFMIDRTERDYHFGSGTFLGK